MKSTAEPAREGSPGAEPKARHVALREQAHREKVRARRAALADSLGLLHRELASFTEVDLEIGCGHGHFLNAYAEAHPQIACLGLDYRNERLQRALRKKERAVRPNLWFVKAEASEFLDALPDGLAFHRVFLLFPDPWPKKRHAKYRLMSPAFLARLATRVKPGGELLFRTDSIAYFEEAQAVIQAHPDWKPAAAPCWPFEHVTVFQAKAPRHFSLVAVRA